MTGALGQQTASADRFAGLDRTFAAVDEAANISTLQELVQTVVVSMLRRGEDASLRERTLATISAYFMHLRGVEGMAPRDKLTHLRSFAKQTVQIVFDQRPMTVEARARLEPILVDSSPRRRAVDQSPVATPAAAPVPVPVP